MKKGEIVMKIKKLATLFLIGLMAFSMAACTGEETDSKKDKKEVESEESSVPSKRDAKKAAEEEYDMSFEFVSEDISKKEDEAEWVFLSKDGTLQVTVTWSEDDPDEFEFEDEEIEVEDDDDDVVIDDDDDDDVVIDDDDDVVIDDDDDDDKPSTSFEAADGLSDVYADLDNRSFAINGVVYTVGVSTLQDLLDDGVEFDSNSAANVSNNVNPNYTSSAFKVELADYYSCSIYVSNFTDTACTASECIISEVYLPVHLDKEPNGIVTFAFPLDMTEEDLIANSGEAPEFREYVSDDGKYTSHYYEYKVDSTKYYGDSGYDFEFSNGELRYVTIDYLP